MDRFVETEWLDALAAEDPRARRSRRDIGRLNAVMGHARIMAGELRSAFSRHLSLQLIELGAGGGEFMLNVARRLRGTFRRATKGNGMRTSCVIVGVLEYWSIGAL